MGLCRTVQRRHHGLRRHRGLRLDARLLSGQRPVLELRRPGDARPGRLGCRGGRGRDGGGQPDPSSRPAAPDAHAAHGAGRRDRLSLGAERARPRRHADREPGALHRRARPAGRAWLAARRARRRRPRLGGGADHTRPARRLYGDRHAGHCRDRQGGAEERRLADQGHLDRLAAAVAGADTQRARLRLVAGRLSERRRRADRRLLRPARARLALHPGAA